jgi:hypothetical protein
MRRKKLEGVHKTYPWVLAGKKLPPASKRSARLFISIITSRLDSTNSTVAYAAHAPRSYTLCQPDDLVHQALPRHGLQYHPMYRCAVQFARPANSQDKEPTRDGEILLEMEQLVAIGELPVEEKSSEQAKYGERCRKDPRQGRPAAINRPPPS